MDNFLSHMKDYLQGNPLIAIIAAYFGGVLTSFTPCVYPIVPITVTYIGARGEGSKIRGFLLCLTHVLGLSITYATLGAFAALTGRFFGDISTNPWAFFITGNIILLFSLSMLGVFNIQAPEFLRRKNPSQGKAKGHLGAFVLGLVAGLVAAPCTAPVLGVILTFVAQKHNLTLGILTLFAFAYGMGTLLILLGTFASFATALPKPGAWMERIKKIFGWLMLLVGEYFLIQCGRFMI
ncbi:MAG: sulfite exporter TauE/SafE family protein [Chlamydiae bacterium]|nr:sulfite exporter TauE/SafE family protein [Chlamydiota bacterium]MBI3265954.1 sulfite exporter TauE/SafE family protein [Chlamydiota bacterium]